jgi:hypothetical protein
MDNPDNPADLPQRMFELQTKTLDPYIDRLVCCAYDMINVKPAAPVQQQFLKIVIAAHNTMISKIQKSNEYKRYRDNKFNIVNMKFVDDNLRYGDVYSRYKSVHIPFIQLLLRATTEMINEITAKAMEQKIPIYIIPSFKLKCSSEKTCPANICFPNESADNCYQQIPAQYLARSLVAHDNMFSKYHEITKSVDTTQAELKELTLKFNESIRDQDRYNEEFIIRFIAKSLGNKYKSEIEYLWEKEFDTQLYQPRLREPVEKPWWNFWS